MYCKAWNFASLYFVAILFLCCCLKGNLDSLVELYVIKSMFYSRCHIQVTIYYKYSIVTLQENLSSNWDQKSVNRWLANRSGQIQWCSF